MTEGPASGSDQFSSVKMPSAGQFAGLTFRIAAIEDVIAQRWTLCILQALSTARVPSTAGLISTYSSSGSLRTKGEAV